MTVNKSRENRNKSKNERVKKKKFREIVDTQKRRQQ